MSDPSLQAMRKHPNKIGYLINLLLISRYIERLADHTTNIAEEVIYMIEGEIIRHAQYKLAYKIITCKPDPYSILKRRPSHL